MRKIYFAIGEMDSDESVDELTSSATLTGRFKFFGVAVKCALSHMYITFTLIITRFHI